MPDVTYTQSYAYTQLANNWANAKSTRDSVVGGDDGTGPGAFKAAISSGNFAQVLKPGFWDDLVSYFKGYDSNVSLTSSDSANVSQLLIGLNGNDFLSAGGGDDWVIANDGNDNILGGPGSDTISAGAGQFSDTIHGDSNYSPVLDSILNFLNGTIGAGGSSAKLPDGNDYIEGGYGADLIYGEGGHDLIFGDMSTANIELINNVNYQRSAVIDVLEVTLTLKGYVDDGLDAGKFAYSVAMFAATGGTTPIAWGVLAQYLATEAISALQSKLFAAYKPATSPTNDDTIYGGTGDDTISGGVGYDQIYGDGGNDQILICGSSFADADYAFGGVGNDTISINGTAGNMLGGVGDDVYLNYGASSRATADLEIIFEASGEGYDTIYTANSALFIQVPYFVERVVLTLPKNFDQYRFDLPSRTVIGTSQAQLIEGIGYRDTVDALAGNDTLSFAPSTSPTGNITNIIRVPDLSGYTGPKVYSAEHDTYLPFTPQDGLISQFSSANPDLPMDGIVDGGAGNDLYLNVNFMSRLTDRVGNGSDTVRSYTGVNLANSPDAEIEYIYLDAKPIQYITNPRELAARSALGIETWWTESGYTLYAYGNGFSQTFFGSTLNDVMFGGGGNDTLYGGDYHDSIGGGIGNDLVMGEAGNDTLFAGAGDDTLLGGDGADQIDAYSYVGIYHIPGAAEADLAIGGAGNDYIKGSADLSHQDRGALLGGLGNDTVEAVGIGYGGTGDDSLIGYGVNDTLYGGYGNDTLNGGGGDDIYREVSATAVIIEQDKGGNDRIQTYGSAFLRDGIEEIELMRTTVRSRSNSVVELARSANITLNDGANQFTSFKGSDVLSGLDGQDTLSGGQGDDLYFGGNDHDLIKDTGTFAALGGTATAKSVFDATADRGIGGIAYLGTQLLVLEQSKTAGATSSTKLVSYVNGIATDLYRSSSSTLKAPDGQSLGNMTHIWGSAKYLVATFAGDPNTIYLSLDGKSFDRVTLDAGRAISNVEMASDGLSFVVDGGYVVHMPMGLGVAGILGLIAEVEVQPVLDISDKGAVRVQSDLGGFTVINAELGTKSYCAGQFVDLSDDGRFALFSSNSRNLAEGQTARAGADLYIFDAVTKQVKLVTAGVNGAEMGGSGVGHWAATFSPDGQTIAFLTSATSFGNMLSGSAADTNNRPDVVFYNISTGTFVRTTLESGLNIQGGSEISFGGRLVFSADGSLLSYVADGKVYEIKVALSGGTAEADTLDGGAGVDTLMGGTGNDVYIVDNASDVIREAEGTGIPINGGNDTVWVRATGQYNITMDLSQANYTGTLETVRVDRVNAGRLATISIQGSNIGTNFIGSALGETISGGAGGDRIDGGRDTLTYVGKTLTEIFGSALAANDGKLVDVLSGGGGNDTILAYGALDRIDGGTGTDVLFTQDGNALAAQIANIEKVVALPLGIGATNSQTATVTYKAAYVQGNDGASIVNAMGNGSKVVAMGGTDEVHAVGQGFFVSLGAGDDSLILDTSGQSDGAAIARSMVFGGDGTDTAVLNLDLANIKFTSVSATLTQTVQEWSVTANTWVDKVYSAKDMLLMQVMSYDYKADVWQVGSEIVFDGVERFTFTKDGNAITVSLDQLLPVAPDTITPDAGPNAIAVAGVNQNNRFVISSASTTGAELISVATEDKNTLDGALKYEFVSGTSVGANMISLSKEDAAQYFTIDADGMVLLRAIPTDAGLFQTNSANPLALPNKVGVFYVRAVDATGRYSTTTAVEFNFATLPRNIVNHTETNRVTDKTSDVLAVQDDIVGGKWNDTIRGGDGNDTIDGRGAESPAGGYGREILDGGAGNDLIKSAPTKLDWFFTGSYRYPLNYSEAAPTVLGGTGRDTLETGYNVDDKYNGVGNGFEVIKLIEPTKDNAALLETAVQRVYADDIGVLIEGNSLSSSLFGGQGNDTINGYGGNDYIKGDQGDALFFVVSALPGLVNGGKDDLLRGGDGNDTLIGGFGRNTLDGGTGNDVLYSYGSKDIADGGAGDDTVSGMRGDHSLSGGAGNDLLLGSADFAVTMQGGDGDDTLVLSSPQNTATMTFSVSGGDGFDKLIFGGNLYLPAYLDWRVTYDFVTDVGGTDFASPVTLTLNDIEWVDVQGNNLSIILTGNTNNYIRTREGFALLQSAGGNDTLVGYNTAPAGSMSTLRGGAGNDTYIIDHVGGGILIDEAVNGGTDKVIVRDASLTSYTAPNYVEEVVFETNNPFGYKVYDGAGNTVYRGGTGTEQFIAGAGNDTIYGDSENDEYIIGNRTDDANVLLRDLVFRATGDGGVVIQNLRAGSQAGTDTVYGIQYFTIGNLTRGIKSILPAAANGYQINLPESTRYYLQSHNDPSRTKTIEMRESFGTGLVLGQLEAHDYNVYINDTHTFRIVNLNKDQAATSVFGANYDRALTAAEAAALIEVSSAGVITVKSMAGLSQLFGSDTITNQTGDAVFGIEITDSTGLVSVFAVGVHVHLPPMKTVSGTYGLSMDDGAVQGGAGADAIYGTLLSDKIFGGAGGDTLVGDTSAATGGLPYLAAFGGHDLLSGGDGNDLISGVVGNDTLDGGTGADTLRGGTGSDYYMVDNWGDRIDENWRDGDLDTDISNVADVDVVQASINWRLGDGLEQLYLSGTAYAGEGSSRADLIEAGSSAAMLVGGAGADTLNGGSGADTLVGGAGNDLLNGGADTDAAAYDGKFSDLTITRQTDGSYIVSGPEGSDTLTGVETIIVDGREQALNLISVTSGSTIRVVGPDGSTAAATVGQANGTVLGQLALSAIGANALRDWNISLVDPKGALVLDGDLLRVANSGLLTAGSYSFTLIARSADGTVLEIKQNIDLNVSATASAEGATTRLGGGNDTFDGGVGADSVSGGAGNDVLTDSGAAGLSPLSSRSTLQIGANNTAVSGALETVILPGSTGFFYSTAATVGGLGAAGTTDIFLLDAATGKVKLVSSTLSGGAINADSTLLDTSADGRYALFSTAGDVGYGTSGQQLYRYDVQSGRISLVSSGAVIDRQLDGEASGVTGKAAMNDAGSLVVFTSIAGFAGVTAGTQQVYLRNMTTGTVSLLSTASPYGTAGNAQISGDGRFVTFETQAQNVGGAAGATVTVLLDRAAGTRTVLTLPSGAKVTDMSVNGATLVFTADLGGFAQAYVYSRATGQYSLISTGTDGAANAAVSGLTLSDNGRFVAFASTATGLVAGVDDGKSHVYVQDLWTGTMTAVPTEAGRAQTAPFFAAGSTQLVWVEGGVLGMADPLTLLSRLGANDTLDGGLGDDTLSGGVGSDLLIGGEGHDSLSGGTNADRLFGGAGNDTLSGGDDADALQGDAGADRLEGNAGSDTLDGGADADSLSGGDGGDRLTGGDGADTLEGGAGIDSLDGGAGTDTAVYAADWLRMSVSRNGAGYIVLDGDGRGPLGGDFVSNVELVSFNGKTGNLEDAIKQAASNITLSTTGFSIVEEAGATLGTLKVTDANAAFGDVQTLSLQQVSGQVDPNSLMRIDADGKGGFVLTLLAADGFAGMTGNYSFAIRTVGLDGLSFTKTMTVSLAGGAMILGSDADDTLTGGRGDDTIDGGAGDDLLSGGAGNDLFLHSGGTDRADGGAGNDVFRQAVGTSGHIYAVYDGAWGDYEFTALADGRVQVRDLRASTVAGFDGTDTLDGAGVELGGIQWDPSKGFAALTPQAPTAISLSGSVVNDGVSVVGRLGATDANAATGDSFSYSFVDADGGLSGNRAAALFDFRTNANGTVDLVTREGAAVPFETASTIAIKVTDSSGKTFVQTFALTAASIHNVVNGGLGNDFIEGRSGVDILQGNAGDDTLSGGTGSDVLLGGGGDDVAVYSGKWTDYTITQSYNTVTVTDNRSGAVNEGSDILSGIDALLFNGTRVDLSSAVGQAASAVSLDTATLPALAAEGRVIGQFNVTDANTAAGDINTLSFANAAGAMSAAQAATLFNITGSGANLQLTAKAGVDYAALGSTVTLAVRATGLDGLSSVHTITLTLGASDPITGTAGADTLTGYSAADKIYGLLGDDVLSGGGGADTLQGGDGQDTLTGGAGDDQLSGGQGIDLVHAGGTRDTVTVTQLADGRYVVSSAAGGSDTVDGVETIEIGGHVGRIEDAVETAPQDIRLSSSNVSQTLAAGGLVATVQVMDPNVSFGDQATVSFVDLAGGLTAAEAEQLFSLVQTGTGANLVAGDINLASFGTNIKFALQAIDLDGNTVVKEFDFSIDRVNQFTPQGYDAVWFDPTYGTKIPESGVIRITPLDFVQDNDPFDPLTLVNTAGSAPRVAEFSTPQAVYTRADDPDQIVTFSEVQFRLGDVFAMMDAGLKVEGNEIVFDLPDTLESLLFERLGDFTRNWSAPDRARLATSIYVKIDYDAQDSFGAITPTRGSVSLTLNGKDAQVTGTLGDDVLAFASATDYRGSGGDDTVFGSHSLDRFVQLSGTASIDGGAGNDLFTLVASGHYAGGAGNDRFIDFIDDGTTPVPTNLRIDGGSGDDFVSLDYHFLNPGQTVVFEGGTGNDSFVTVNYGADITLVYDTSFANLRLDGSATGTGFDLTDIRDASVAGHLGTDWIVDMNEGYSGPIMLEIDGHRGSIYDAISAAPTDLKLSTTTLVDRHETGAVLADLTVTDRNAVFGDVSSFDFVNRAGGLTAAQAQSLFRFENGQLVANSDDLSVFGNAMLVSIRATDAQGLSTVFTVDLNLRAPSRFAPVGHDDQATVTESGAISLNVLANDTDRDAGASLSVITRGQEAPSIDSAVIQTENGPVDLAVPASVTLRGEVFQTADLLASLQSALHLAADGALSLTLPAALDAILIDPATSLPGMAGLYSGLQLTLTYRVTDESGRAADDRSTVVLNVTGSDDARTGTASAELIKLDIGGAANGGGGADTIIGSDGNDLLQLGSNAAGGVLEGMGGDDLLIGGTGTTARYSGVSYSDLSIRALSPAADGSLRFVVTDLRADTVAGHSGQDTLQGVDSIEIGGTRILLASAVNSAPTDVALTGSHVLQTAAAGTVVGQFGVTDANAVFGDTASLQFGDAAGGLTAAQAAALFDIVVVGGVAQLRVAAGADLLAYGPAPLVAITATDRGGLTYTEAMTVTIDRINQSTPVNTAETVTIGDETHWTANLLDLMAEGDRFDPLHVLTDGPYAPVVKLVGTDTDTLRNGEQVGSYLQALQDAFSISADGTVDFQLPKVWADDLIAPDGQLFEDIASFALQRPFVIEVYVADTLSPAGTEPAKLTVTVNFNATDGLTLGTTGSDFAQLTTGTVYDGNGGSDEVWGSALRDVILLGTGSHFVDAGAGGDLIVADGGDGAFINGGAGNDVIRFGNGASSLYGDEGDDTIYVRSGHSTVSGGAGNDLIVAAGPGVTAHFDALYGWDEFIFNRAADGSITARYNGTNGMDMGVDTLRGVTYVEIAPSFGETFVGEIDDLFAQAADLSVRDVIDVTDQLAPRTAVAIIDAVDVNSVFGDYQTMSFVDAEGGLTAAQAQAAFQLRPGAGFSWLQLRDFAALTGLRGDIVVSVQSIGIDGLASVIDIHLNVKATPTAVGSDGVDRIAGSSGADLIFAGGGNDVVRGSAGADTLDGGDGRNTLDYSKSTAGIQINLGSGTASGGYAQGDVFKNFAAVIGSAHADTLTGSDGADALTGGAGDDLIDGAGGDDVLQGGLGNDQIAGGDGNDLILGGQGADTLDGGAGTNTLSYAGSRAAVLVNLDIGTASGGDAGGDVFMNFANIVGSSLNDTLSGDAMANQIKGGLGADLVAGLDGNDVLFGNDGADTVNGGAGNDVITGGAGADSMDGGTGVNTLSYAGSLAAVSVNLGTGAASGGDAAGDTFTNFSRLTGSSFDDTLSGGSGDGVISGGLGNDLVTGGIGNDVLSGGEGADTVQGGAGNDVINGGAGADNMDGGAGINSLTYASSAAAVSVNLATGTASGGDAAGDVFTNFSRVIGSGFNDTLTGGALADQLIGGLGADLITGNAGDDNLSAGDGADTVYGGAGRDIVYGGNGSDRVWGGADADQLFGGGDADVFVFRQGDGADRLRDFSLTDGDRIELSASLWAAEGTLGADQVIDHYAHVIGGRMALQFASGDVLYLDGITSTTGLAAQLDIV